MMVARGLSEPAYISLPPGLRLSIEHPEDVSLNIPLSQEKNCMIGWEMFEGIRIPDKVVIFLSHWAQTCADLG